MFLNLILKATIYISSRVLKFIFVMKYLKKKKKVFVFNFKRIYIYLFLYLYVIAFKFNFKSDYIYSILYLILKTVSPANLRKKSL